MDIMPTNRQCITQHYVVSVSSNEIYKWNCMALPEEGAEPSRTELHGPFDSKEAQKNVSNSLHYSQVVELFHILGEDLL